jgi:hypothetical protein
LPACGFRAAANRSSAAQGLPIEGAERGDFLPTVFHFGGTRVAGFPDTR